MNSNECHSGQGTLETAILAPCPLREHYQGETLVKGLVYTVQHTLIESAPVNRKCTERPEKIAQYGNFKKPLLSHECHFSFDADTNKRRGGKAHMIGNNEQRTFFRDILHSPDLPPGQRPEKGAYDKM